MTDDSSKRFSAPSFFPKRVRMPGFRGNGFVSLHRQGTARSPLEQSIQVERELTKTCELLEYPDDPTKPAAVAADVSIDSKK